MKTVIHVNQHIIKSNSKTNSIEPVITVKTYKSNQYGNNVDILDEFGFVVATIKYSPNAPLPCGAKVWIETEHDVIIRN